MVSEAEFLFEEEFESTHQRWCEVMKIITSAHMGSKKKMAGW